MYRYIIDKTYYLDGLGPIRFKPGEIVPKEVLKALDSDTLKRCCKEVPKVYEAKTQEPGNPILPKPEIKEVPKVQERKTPPKKANFKSGKNQRSKKK